MKKVLLFTLATIICTITVKAQIVHIPDANFKVALLNHTPIINTNGDGEIQVSEAEAFTGKLLIPELKIADITGIEAFINISALDCQNNQLTSLDVSSNIALTDLACNDNSLTSLNLSNNTALKKISCHRNNLINLDVSKNKFLQYLLCYNNKLTSLNLSSNTALRIISCDDNNLTNLDLSSNTALINISCDDNNLTNLDLSNSKFLQSIYCYSNSLTSLNVANKNNSSLKIFHADDNPNLTCIQVDDSTYSKSKWIGDSFGFDENVSFSEDCAITGVNDQTANTNEIIFFPNPTTNQINFSAYINVRLTNLKGQSIIDRKNTNMLDISNQAAGVYLLLFINNNGEVVQRSKIVKE